ncbi:TetR/AcrR family transcriptional regulator [Janibacter sp. G56]|uniref:TetR/AcrR family transcriptional regulator n=1 Tax=Janibacter sp. G56 TaxID=3418717 RepID=UPI003D05FB4E
MDTAIEAPEPEDAAPGLRERQKDQRRRALHLAALELALSEGLGSVTVDAIAARAGVSTRTFFNYYATKESALMGWDADAVERVGAAVQARPAEESVTETLRAVLTGYITDLAADDERWRLRVALAAQSPELAAKMVGVGAQIERACVTAAIARAHPDLETADTTTVVEAHVAVAAFRAALWQHRVAGFTGDLRARLDAAFDLVGAVSDARA